MKKVIMGNHAVSYGVRASEAKVISAYPITPQTHVVELLSEMCASGEIDAKFIKVESEHSAMAACVGASAAGSRFLHEHISSTDKTLKIYPGLFHEIFNEPEREQVIADALKWCDRLLESG